MGARVGSERRPASRRASGRLPSARLPSERPTSEPRPIFERRTFTWLAAFGAVSFVAALLFSALGPELAEDDSDAADAYSRSALGHHALVLALEATGLDVVVSRHDSALKTGPTAPLFVAEPRLLHAGESGASDVPLETGLRALTHAALERGADVVVVLPKWRGRAHATHPGWVERVELRSVDDAGTVLGLATDRPKHAASVVRPAATTSFRTTLTSAPGTPIDLESGAGPSLPAPQLVAPDAGLEPVVWSNEGVLVGRVTPLAASAVPAAPGAGGRAGRVYVLSDPDLLNNAGLGRGGNARVLEALLGGALGAQALVVDETLHGFGRPPSLWADLLRFPLVLATAHVALVLGLLVWMMVGRFGRAEPLPARVPPGAAAIVATAAELLETGRHRGTLEHYLRLRLRRAAEGCGLPQDLPEATLHLRLGAIGRARGCHDDPATLVLAAAAEGGHVSSRALAVARRIHRYCQEITHGHG
ncbi:MAG: hypothetical protein IT373_36045 [Polyangiaceae bacterium]|nr:hypothetical protein [Polyangiaceae bacterium]